MNNRAAGNARLQALKLLDVVQSQGQLLSESKSDQDRNSSFARRLAYGVLRNRGALDWILEQLLSKPLKARERDIQGLLQIGIYQLWLEDTADHAAVHETAECARLRGKKWATGLINAVLRRFIRERDELLGGLEQQTARFSHPDWMLDQLRDDWPEQWQSIAQQNNQRAPLWLRANTSQITLQALEQNLAEAGYKVTPHPSAPEALKIEPAASVSDITGFSSGHCSVQDPAAQLAAGLVQARTGEHVLDACSAPGGKACHLLELTPEIKLTAVELSARRATKISENASRLKLKLDVTVADALKTDSWFDGNPFDRILLDAPCSATGVIRRHPEIKWLRSPEQVEQAVSLQAQLLEALWPLLRPGGILVYATCSILECENAGQVRAFLDKHPDARCNRPDAFPGSWQQPGHQIFPGEEEMDGFYYAVLEKQN